MNENERLSALRDTVAEWLTWSELDEMEAQSDADAKRMRYTQGRSEAFRAVIRAIRSYMN